MVHQTSDRPVTSLGHQVGQSFLRSSNFLNYVQHIFPGGAKNLVTGLTSDRHVQAVMNDLKFLILDYLAAKKFGILD